MTGTKRERKRYDGVDGLRAYAIMGIVLMHVRYNGEYQVDGFIFNRIIPSFTNFVFLFMMMSGFGICCGYFDKLLNHRITIEDFYTKRYAKNWPFFALLCFLDLLISPGLNTFYEVFANLTLCFGLLPNAKIGVIGVGWTLGVIFVFYLLFPFFCYLLGNRKRAWLTLVATLIFNILCGVYFFDADHMPGNFQARTSFIYCAVYFAAGGMIYLYKDSLSKMAGKYRWSIGICCILSMVLYFAIGASTVTILLVNALLLIYTIGITRQGGLLCNPYIKFLGSISFEIYLCHMVIYRILEKLHLLHVHESGLISYCMAAIGTIGGSVLFALCGRYFLNAVNRLYHRYAR